MAVPGSSPGEATKVKEGNSKYHSEEMVAPSYSECRKVITRYLESTTKSITDVYGFGGTVKVRNGFYISGSG